MFECDGCGVIGTEEEVEQHVMTVNTLADGTLRPLEDVVCFGVMEVGGIAWLDFHMYNKHPMENVVDMIKEALP